MSLPPLVDPVAALPDAERGRTDRQRRLPEIGDIGQRRLAAARVIVIGTGGLGAPALTYLAAAGIGTIGIVDDDVVELSNLHRQPVHGVSDVGRPKVDSAAESIAALAPDATIVRHQVRLEAGNARELLGGYDLVVDGTDTFETRYLVDDVCAELGLPLVWATVLRFDAQLSVFWATPPTGHGIRLRTLFPEPPAPGEVPSCAEAGVLGALCGQVGAMMAQEAVKLITGIGDPLLGRVLVIDALRARQREIPLLPTHVATVVESPIGEADASANAATPRLTPRRFEGIASRAEQGTSTARGAGEPGTSPDSKRPPASGSSQPASRDHVRAAIAADVVAAAPVATAADPVGASAAPVGASADLGSAIEWADVDALRERLQRRAAGQDRFILVDVREPDEYEEGAIPGSVLLPLGEVLRDPAGARAALRTATDGANAGADAPLVVHCRTDRRAERAALVLARVGEPVTVLRGGYLAWTDEHASGGSPAAVDPRSSNVRTVEDGGFDAATPTTSDRSAADWRVRAATSDAPSASAGPGAPEDEVRHA
jgi:adenylyltransferase/sulfurtransferase